MSETRAIRGYVEGFCKGRGLDIGCGSEKIVSSAIGIDYKMQYNDPKHSAGPTAADYAGSWQMYFSENPSARFDYIYSSHLLEDSADAPGTLAEWAKRVYQGGKIILCLPNERLYKETCVRSGTRPNQAHKNAWDGSADFIKQVVGRIRGVEVVASGDTAGYSFWVVMTRTPERIVVR